jgi:hypothetical protein
MREKEKQINRNCSKQCTAYINQILLFKVKILNDGSRNPNLLKKLENLNDDEKWLLMSENRPSRMNWIILIPKSV